MLDTGSLLSGRYRILSQLGAGGMGEVYRARDLRLERDVAVKVLPLSMARQPEAVSRFDREAKALAALSHPNILTIYDFGTDRDLCYAVMEILEGETLRQRLLKGPLSWRAAVRIGATLADGLAAAHARGIVHRDLKPENVQIVPGIGIKILDFGLARQWLSGPVEETSAERTEASAERTRIISTQPGVLLGTIPYMSPEQLRGLPVDARSDIFSLGSILLEMVSGAAPFARASQADTAAAILKEDPPLPEEGDVPVAVLRVIADCLRKDPADRIASASEVASVLRAALDGGSAEPASTRTRPATAVHTPTSHHRARRRRPIDSLAVLPLANAGSDPNAEYLSDGITESIINSLSILPKLRVMARSTVFRYKNEEPDPVRVGEDLNVRAIVTGRVVQRGEALNIQAELVDTSDGSQLWGQHYSHRLEDIFTVQDEIANEICRNLRLKLSGDDRARIAKRYTYDPGAYDLYLKGRFHWAKRTAEGFRHAVEYFERAIERDPKYALAYAGLADCFNLLSAYGILPPNDSVPRGRAAAQRALEFDPTLVEAHEALAYAMMLYDWDWPGAEAAFLRAIELNANYASAHQRYAIYLTTMGRLDEAAEQIARALESDPLSLIINTHVGLIHFYRGQNDRAYEQYQRTLELDPRFPIAHFALGLFYVTAGKMEEALREFEVGIQVSGDESVVFAMGYIHAISGRREEALRALETCIDLSRRRYVSPYAIAVIFAGLGEKDRAFEWLRKACDAKAVWMIHRHFSDDPWFSSLRSDPRFDELLRRVRLPRIAG